MVGKQDCCQLPTVCWGAACFTALPPSKVGVAFWRRCHVDLRLSASLEIGHVELNPGISILNLMCISIWLFLRTHVSSAARTKLLFHFSVLRTCLVLRVAPAFVTSPWPSCSCWRSSLCLVARTLCGLSWFLGSTASREIRSEII